MELEPNGSPMVMVSPEELDRLYEALDRLTKTIEVALEREKQGGSVDLQQLWTDIKEARSQWPTRFLPDRGQL